MPEIDLRRWRWRMRGAWQWPTFVALTVGEAFLLVHLPVWGNGPQDGYVAAGLLAACLNLIVVAVLAPFAGMLVRLRRRDLPRAIAANYAGTVLLLVLGAGLLASGLERRDERAAQWRDLALSKSAVDDWVRREEPAFAPGLTALDTIRLQEDLYRGCVPGTGIEDPLCVFVDVHTGAPTVRRDPERVGNEMYRAGGGF